MSGRAAASEHPARFPSRNAGVFTAQVQKGVGPSLTTSARLKRSHRTCTGGAVMGGEWPRRWCVNSGGRIAQQRQQHRDKVFRYQAGGDCGALLAHRGNQERLQGNQEQLPQLLVSPAVRGLGKEVLDGGREGGIARELHGAENEQAEAVETVGLASGVEAAVVVVAAQVGTCLRERKMVRRGGAGRGLVGVGRALPGSRRTAAGGASRRNGRPFVAARRTLGKSSTQRPLVGAEPLPRTEIRPAQQRDFEPEK